MLCRYVIGLLVLSRDHDWDVHGGVLLQVAERSSQSISVGRAFLVVLVRFVLDLGYSESCEIGQGRLRGVEVFDGCA